MAMITSLALLRVGTRKMDIPFGSEILIV